MAMTPDMEPFPYGGREIPPPVRICCGQRHWDAVCPDGLVMCCICFSRFRIDQLAVDPSDGKHWDVCLQCAADEEAEMRKRS
jgi:hypothetical protein